MLRVVGCDEIAPQTNNAEKLLKPPPVRVNTKEKEKKPPSKQKDESKKEQSDREMLTVRFCVFVATNDASPI